FTLGAYGAVSSLTMVFTGSVSLPASSVDVTSNSSPPFKSISLGIVTTYFPSASVSPVAVSPLGNLIVTVVLGSASPVICASSLVTLFTIGGAGAVSSVTVVAPGCEALPVVSVAVALIVSLPCRFSLSVIATVKLPSSSAIVSAIAPLGNVILTVAFASTLPVTSVLTLVTCLICVVSGAVLSITSVLPDSETLPATSVAVASIVSPLFNPAFSGIATV